MKKSRIKLVIFDLDGVLLDSEPLHENAKRKILGDFGINEKIDLSWSVGQPNKKLWEKLIGKFNIEKTAEELEKNQYDYILEDIKQHHIEMSKNLIELLQWLRNNEITIGLASSSNRYYVDSILCYYEISSFFDYIVAGDEVPQKKPEPDAYLKVLSLSGKSAKETIAIEDSKAGIAAAVSAGIPCIGYKNMTSGQQDLSKSNYQINGINELIGIISEVK